MWGSLLTLTREIWLKLIGRKPNTMGLREKKRRGLRTNINCLFKKCLPRKIIKLLGGEIGFRPEHVKQARCFWCGYKCWKGTHVVRISGRPACSDSFHHLRTKMAEEVWHWGERCRNERVVSIETMNGLGVGVGMVRLPGSIKGPREVYVNAVRLASGVLCFPATLFRWQESWVQSIQRVKFHVGCGFVLKWLKGQENKNAREWE